jgi:oligoendopeptidase F
MLEEDPMSLIHELRDTFMRLHEGKESLFWHKAMDLSGYQKGSWEKADIEMKRFTSDPSWLGKVRKETERTGISEADRAILYGWQRFFEANTIESLRGREMQEEMVEMEGELARKKADAHLGYADPKTGEHVQASPVKLRLMVLTNDDETVRKAAWEGLHEIEGWLLDHGLLDIVSKRNEIGRALGYDDFYSWRVQINEGLSKQVIFDKLDELEVNTRDACKRLVDAVKKEHGESGAQPWNFDYLTRGDLTKQRAPYLTFDTSVERWGRSFAALGVRLNHAKLQLDLVDRRGKYENGFMHSPKPSFLDSGSHETAVINFTANAVPGQPGSGQRALETLFHEGGHAAHFANVMMPAPCFGQEYAPTSIALAETQSMFMDNFIADPDWMQRYALDHDGKPIPTELIHATVEEDLKTLAHGMRSWMAVPYFEKTVYEMLDMERTPESVMDAARKVEKKMSFQPALARPTLSVPHLQDNESSAYYHAYVLAQMAVYQLRDFFRKRDGHLLDNPNIGRDLAKVIWSRGNEKDFMQFIHSLTGEEFSAKATVNLVNKDLETIHREVDEALAKEKSIPKYDGPIDLQHDITMIHGDKTISNSQDASSFPAMAEAYANWIKEMEAAAID